MKFLLFTAFALSISYTNAQTELKFADTNFKKLLIRNNLDGQKLVAKTEKGNIYRLRADGMACFAPDESQLVRIPNAFRKKENVEVNADPYYYSHPRNSADSFYYFFKPDQSQIMTDDEFKKEFERLKKEKLQKIPRK